MSYTICLNMIVKNESHIIESTLCKLCKKIKIDYYVICDTGSTDNTPSIIKHFFQEQHIPGELYFDTWVNFAVNRTIALEYAFKKTDYILIFDADDTIVGDFHLPETLVYDAYYFNFGEKIRYVRPLLINNHKKWKFESVIHEYLVECEANIQYGNLEGNYYVESGRLGSRNQDPEKYLHDAKILQEAFYQAEKQADPIKNRYAFYTANSYFDYRDYNNSLLWYKKVLTLDNWTQEKYIASLKIALIYKMQDSYENLVYYNLQSFQYDPKRVEGICSIIMHYSSLDQVEIAYNFYKFIQQYYEIEYQSDTSLKNKLFINESIYKFTLPYMMILIADKLKDFTLVMKMFCAIFLRQYIPDNHTLPFNVLSLFGMAAKTLPVPNNVMSLYFSYQKIVLQRFANYSKKVLLYTGNCPLQWNKTYSTQYGLGGSERANIYLSECFPKDYEIFITGNVASEQIDNITFVPIHQLEDWLHTNILHTVIVSRYINFFELFPFAKSSRYIIWAHDTDLMSYGTTLTASEILQKYDDKINNFVFLTHWHQQLLVKKYPWIETKSVIINNGIVSIPDFKQTKIPNSFVYTSCSERGLKRLLYLWPSILKLFSNATLRIASYNPFPRNEEEKELQKIILDYPNSISHCGTLSPNQLYALLQQSEFWLYPSYWPETSCITSMEMMQCGVVCLYYPVAGLPETIANIGLQIKEGNELLALSLITDTIKQELIHRGKEYTANCLWSHRFQQWSKILDIQLPNKKVISFSLWGDCKMYTIGALKNARLAQEIYPEFECWFYVHQQSVPSDIIQQLESYSNVKIIFKEGDLSSCKPAMWRFECIDHPQVDVALIRDTDSRLNSREKSAVQDWLTSNKKFHIMRDHPYHTVPILAGMFGTKKLDFKWNDLMAVKHQNNNKGYDQDFLQDSIYPLIVNNSMIHANFYSIEPFAIRFPIHYDAELHYVGEVFDENDIRDAQSYKVLKIYLSQL